jgi:hypothetical protein
MGPKVAFLTIMLALAIMLGVWGAVREVRRRREVISRWLPPAWWDVDDRPD